MKLTGFEISEIASSINFENLSKRDFLQKYEDETFETNLSLSGLKRITGELEGEPPSQFQIEFNGVVGGATI